MRFYELAKGTHVIVDCSQVPRTVCLDDGKMLGMMAEAVENTTKMTIIGQMRYKFGHDSPPGFTAILMLDESHLSCHTYADDGAISADFFTCGDTDPEVIFNYMRSKMDMGVMKVRIIERF